MSIESERSSALYKLFDILFCIAGNSLHIKYLVKEIIRIFLAKRQRFSEFRQSEVKNWALVGRTSTQLNFLQDEHSASCVVSFVIF